MRFDLFYLRCSMMFILNYCATTELMLCAVANAVLIGRLLHSFRPFMLCVLALSLIFGIQFADSLVGYDLSIPAQYEMN